MRSNTNKDELDKEIFSAIEEVIKLIEMFTKRAPWAIICLQLTKVTLRFIKLKNKSYPEFIKTNFDEKIDRYSRLSLSDEKLRERIAAIYNERFGLSTLKQCSRLDYLDQHFYIIDPEHPSNPQ